MKRRSIFKLLAGAACAAAIEITGALPRLPRLPKGYANPEYLTAAYEMMILGNPKSYQDLMGKFSIPNVASARFNFIGGKWVEASEEIQPKT